jgi:hypothetical protein
MLFKCWFPYVCPCGCPGGGWRGSIQIKRKGMSDFTYECAVNGSVIQDNMSSNDSSDTVNEGYEVKVLTPVAASFGVGSSDVREIIS